MIESTNKIKNNSEILFMYLPYTSSTAIKLIPSIDLQCKTFRDRFTSFKLPRQEYLNFCCPLEKSRNMHVYVRIEMYFKMAIYALLGTVQKRFSCRPGAQRVPFSAENICHGHRGAGCGVGCGKDVGHWRGRIGSEGWTQSNPTPWAHWCAYISLTDCRFDYVSGPGPSTSPLACPGCGQNYAKYLLISFFSTPHQINWHLLLEKGLAWKCKNAKNFANGFGHGDISSIRTDTHTYLMRYGHGQSLNVSAFTDRVPRTFDVCIELCDGFWEGHSQLMANGSWTAEKKGRTFLFGNSLSGRAWNVGYFRKFCTL